MRRPYQGTTRLEMIAPIDRKMVTGNHYSMFGAAPEQPFDGADRIDWVLLCVRRCDRRGVSIRSVEQLASRPVDVERSIRITGRALDHPRRLPYAPAES